MNDMDENIIRSVIEEGVAQVDDSLIVTDFDSAYNKDTRKLNVFFTAKKSNDETFEVSNTWG